MAVFDPGALVAMLTTFYPVISGAELARARQERPEFFGGGVLFGSKGDKLRLPDGREFDCIVASGGPIDQRRWQCAPIDPNAAGDDDPFALEPGPLEPLEDVPFTPRDPDTFQTLVGRELGGLGDWEGAYDGARATAIASDDGGGGGDDPELVAWADELAGAGAERGQYLPGDELGAIDGISPQIDQAAGNVTEDPAGLTPDAPDLPPYNEPPANPPPDTGTGEPPK